MDKYQDAEHVQLWWKGSPLSLSEDPEVGTVLSARSTQVVCRPIAVAVRHLKNTCLA